MKFLLDMDASSISAAEIPAVPWSVLKVTKAPEGDEVLGQTFSSV